MKKVTLIIPCYNEEESLPLLYKELCKLSATNDCYEWEYLFINDGSKDATLATIKGLRADDERVSFVDLSRNFGKERAMLAGFDYATGDCAVIIDADLQHTPHVISEMLQKWEEGYDDIYAKRKTRGKESWLRKTLSLSFYKLLGKISRIELLPNVGDFRLLDRRCIEALKAMRESERYTKGLYCWIGFKKTFVEFEQADRVAGESKWSFFKLLSLAIEGIVSFSTAPLKIATVAGFICALASIIYSIYFFVKSLVYGDPVAGFPTLIITILLIGGLQLICLGIIGEYIGRIFNESKRRPVYFVREHESGKA